MPDWSPVALNLPECEFQFRKMDGARMVLDPARERWVVLTPEEWVRLHVVQFLIKARSVPRGLIGVEVDLTYEGRRRRADIVVYRSDGSPALVVECKAPKVILGQSVVDQASRYNYTLRAQTVMVTNGLVHYVFRFEGDRAVFLPDLPSFAELVGGPKAEAAGSRSTEAGR
jgi:hypothetical protein